MRAALDVLMQRFPWVQMVIFSELAALDHHLDMLGRRTARSRRRFAKWRVRTGSGWCRGTISSAMATSFTTRLLRLIHRAK